MNSAQNQRWQGNWLVSEESGRAAEFHSRDVELPAQRQVMIFHVTHNALVLGSAQPLTDVDATQSGEYDIVHRRSGGGAVLLEPDRNLWIDVVVPRDDVLWNDDVGQATWWLGDVWANALRQCGFTSVTVHKAGLESAPLAKVVCFAGLGPGEVAQGELKLVGISQRRTREAARFQCCVLSRFDVELHHRLLSPGWARVGAPAETALAVAEIAQLEALKKAFLAQLPQ